MRAPFAQLSVGFPRYFRFGRHWINSYKVLMCVGMYLGTIASAALAAQSGLSPLRVAVGCVMCAVLGLGGARLYHVLVNARAYLSGPSRPELWNSRRGGMNVFGALIPVVPLSFAVAFVVGIPAAVFWDHMSIGVLVGGFWIRLGCVFNGCCVGRRTESRFGVWLHDTRGVRIRRVPVQFMEMAWWATGLAAFLWIWPLAQPGNAALAVLAWYGFGRFWLEPLREAPDVVFRRVRVDQVVAALLVLIAGGALLARLLID